MREFGREREREREMPLKDPFDQKKQSITAQIEATDETNPDASPKGTLDKKLVPLIDLINDHPDMVTTSSCSGRVSVFLQGRKPVDDGRGKIGGKGDGGKWLYVTHDPDDIDQSCWWDKVKEYQEEDGDNAFGDERYVLFKFEPMILHVKCRDRDTAAGLYTAAMACGFRESGIGSNDLVGIRISMRLDVPIALLNGRRIVPLVLDEYIDHLNSISKDLFLKNFRKISELHAKIERLNNDKPEIIESKEERRERKRRQGLLRQAQEATDPELHMPISER
jgi:tRNA wybutosine-synthesizing protein 3